MGTVLPAGEAESMSLGKLPAAGVVFVLCSGLGRPALAQFVEPEVEATGATQEKENATLLDLRLILSSFAYLESGSASEPLFDGGEELETASRARRAFADLRLDLRAKQIAGSKFELRFDGRLRESNRDDVQSGFRGGEEWDLRDAFVRYGDEKRALTLGRQRIAAVDASKVDGISLQMERGALDLVLFGGLYPTRGSRSVTQDYPRGTQLVDDEGATMAAGKRIAPAIVGAGGSYAKPSTHGSIGVGAIIPFRSDGLATSRERPRFFAHSNGYWQASKRTSFFHYATADLAGPNGAAVRNLSAAIRSQATDTMMLRLSAHHHSTELLRESVVTQLQEPDTSSTGLVQNNLSMSRVASQAIRTAISFDASKRRFQFTLSGGVRQRPEVKVDLADGSFFAFQLSRRGEVSVQVLDRRSVLGLRINGQLSVLRGLGKRDSATSRGGVASIAMSRDFLEDRITLSVDAAAQSLEDAGRHGFCDETGGNACYGESRVQAIQVGLQAATQWSQAWLFLVDGHWGLEQVETRNSEGRPLPLPSVHSVTGFARLRYRFR